MTRRWVGVGVRWGLLCPLLAGRCVCMMSDHSASSHAPHASHAGHHLRHVHATCSSHATHARLTETTERQHRGGAKDSSSTQNKRRGARQGVEDRTISTALNHSSGHPLRRRLTPIPAVLVRVR